MSHKAISTYSCFPINFQNSIKFFCNFFIFYHFSWNRLFLKNWSKFCLINFRSIYSWASVSSDCTITIWDTRQHPANVLTRRLDRSANCLLFSPNDAFIAIGSDQLYMMDPRIRDMRSLPTSSQVSNSFNSTFNSIALLIWFLGKILFFSLLQF